LVITVVMGIEFNYMMNYNIIQTTRFVFFRGLLNKKGGDEIE